MVGSALYLLDLDGGSEPQPLTPEPSTAAALRYADPVLSPDGREMWWVREEHVGEGTDSRRHARDRRASRSTVLRPTTRHAVRVVVSGSQFLAFPSPSPDGGKLAWIAWNHPNMPWDATELRVGELVDGTVPSWRRAARADARSRCLSRCGPTRSTLYAVSDRSGWWNLYRVDAAGGGRADSASRRAPRSSAGRCGNSDIGAARCSTTAV